MIEFSNAQELQRKYPDTFQAPNKATLNRIKPGDIVKVCACHERFWAKVVTIENGVIQASMDNDLGIEGLRLGDIITFSLDNIYIVRQ